jgi:threonine/homoserine/homoserine lactone efflux protein
MTPGPDLLLIARLVLTHGRTRPAEAAAAGMITAGAAQVSLGAAGLAALLAVNPALFVAFRWAGAAVLLGWAVLALRSALRPVNGDTTLPEPPAQRAFLQGLLCTGSNPKVGVFLMAFLPQFVPAGVDPASGIARLAAIYLAMGLLWLLVWTNLVHRLSRFVRVPTTSRIADGVIAVVFGFFAARLILGS